MAQPPNPSKPPPYNPEYPQQTGYPAQPGYPPQQGYPPPQGYPPQQGQQGYQPPPYSQPQVVHATHQTNVVVQPANRSQFSGSLGGLFKSAEKALNSAANTVQHEVDRYACSPTLSMFINGNIVRLQSRETGRYLQVMGTGALGANADPNDPSAHFKVLNYGHNIVILQSAIYPTCHIANHGGNIIGNGNGDNSCRFRLHETMSGFVTFESVIPANQHIGVTAQGQIKQGHLARKDNSAMFSPSIVSSQYAHTVQVQRTTTTTTYRK